MAEHDAAGDGPIVIVGGGQAALSCAAKYRSLGGTRPVTILCAESVPPYQRPPLSKAYLLGDMGLDRLLLRPQSWYDDNAVTLRLSTRATALDPQAGTISIEAGEVIPFGDAVLTTGSAPRHLPAAIGGALAGVHVVRDLADVDALEPVCVEGARVVIVGGGYIGLEAAAVCSKRGMQVTVLEAAPRILGRVAAQETADAIRTLHAEHGVDIREGTPLERIEGAEAVTGVTLKTGETLPADLVIAGIGIVPETALAEGAGLTIDNGIATDAQGRSSHPHVWAAGDCASFPYGGGRLRLESVQNAIDQAECVAANLAGRAQDYDPKPWFWSDQYDLKLQIAGLNTGHDQVVVRQGEGSARSHWYFRDGGLISVDALNDPRGYMVGKRMIENGISPAPEVLADPAADLKALLKAG